MEENLHSNCRLCNYRSDERLMLKVFDEPSDYASKIENYLNLKIYRDDKTSSGICFHCSQTLDNFHSFASKIKAIQKILFPEQVQQVQIQEISYEICVIPSDDTIFKETSQEKICLVQEDSSEHELLSKYEEFEETLEAPSQKLPSKLLDNGLLLYKGEELMSMMSSFYWTGCELCSKKLNNIPELFSHQKKQHNITPYITCCETKMTKMPSLIWHFVKHIEPESFRCHICSYSVSRPKFLERHLQVHADPSEKKFSCDRCDKRFIWKGALRSHLANHQPETERKDYRCDLCDRKYLSSGSLTWHKKSAHSAKPIDKTKNLCEICSKTFATLTSFKEHMLTHSEDSEKLQLRCNICSKWLKNQRCLKSHMLLHNDVEHKCTMCSYTNKKEHLVKNHIITKHTSDRPWSCDECDKTFKTKRALTVHKAQNHTTGAKTGRTCEFCNKTFGSSTNYYTHRKNLHADELTKILAMKDEEKKLKRIQIGLEKPS